MLAGNSIHCDWLLIRRFLPELAKRLHYRHLDVTALKLLWRDRFAGPEFDKDDAGQVRAAFPDSEEPFDSRRHDAYYDVRASIAELSFYLGRLGLARALIASDGRPVLESSSSSSKPRNVESP